MFGNEPTRENESRQKITVFATYVSAITNEVVERPNQTRGCSKICAGERESHTLCQSLAEAGGNVTVLDGT
jgi:hypothetical protein